MGNLLIQFRRLASKNSGYPGRPRSPTDLRTLRMTKNVGNLRSARHGPTGRRQTSRGPFSFLDSNPSGINGFPGTRRNLRKIRKLKAENPPPLP